MSNITIFENAAAFPTVRRESKLITQRVPRGSSIRRIATNTNGTFKRIVGGDQIGKAIPHEINVIVVGHLDPVSRQFYANEYDPTAKPTLPDCWSNLGDKPDASAPNPAASSCAVCPKNVNGSGKSGRGRACRYNRRLAVMAEGDPSGDVYQLTVAGGSLFGDGVDSIHPFESYRNYLEANGEYTDTVVTKVMYDIDADTMTLSFKALRHLTEVESSLVDAAQENPETQKYIQLTVAQADGVTAKPAAIAAPKKAIFAPVVEDAEEEEPKPVKRASKKESAPADKQDLASVLNAWGDDE